MPGDGDSGSCDIAVPGRAAYVRGRGWIFWGGRCFGVWTLWLLGSDGHGNCLPTRAQIYSAITTGITGIARHAINVNEL